MSNPAEINQFHTQINQAGQNLLLIDKKLQSAIIKAQQAGDYEQAEDLSALQAEIAAIKQDTNSSKTPAEAAILAKATTALVQLNNKMSNIIKSNKNTAALINDVSDFLNKSTDLWSSATQR